MNFGYAFPIGKQSFYVQAGPYASFCLGNSLGEEMDINSFNAGLGFMAGINIKRFKIEIGYQLGLTKLYEGTYTWTEGGYGYGDSVTKTEKYSQKLNSLFLGVSYVF